MMIFEDKLLFSREAAARATDLSVRGIDYVIESGALETIRVGKRVMIPRDALITFCKRGCLRVRPHSEVHAAEAT
jgi:hypothetical protein